MRIELIHQLLRTALGNQKQRLSFPHDGRYTGGANSKNWDFKRGGRLVDDTRRVTHDTPFTEIVPTMAAADIGGEEYHLRGTDSPEPSPCCVTRNTIKLNFRYCIHHERRSADGSVEYISGRNTILTGPGSYIKADNTKFIDGAHGVDNAQPPELIPIFEAKIHTTKLNKILKHMFELLAGEELNSFRHKRLVTIPVQLSSRGAPSYILIVRVPGATSLVYSSCPAT